jgi:exosortase A-associated hydrolase 2
LRLEPSFLAVDGSPRFCLLHLPEGRPRGNIVYLHPFAEELNRSRHVVAEQARALADRGYAVLQIDLYGCGDSAGDFADADWAQWRRDGLAAVQLLRNRFEAPLCLWGLRAGALLAAELAEGLDDQVGLLLWQPVLSGKQHLQQFLRLNLAADMLDGKSGGNTEALLAQLEAGIPVEVAGYTIAPGLAAGLASSVLRAGRRMHCVEILPGGGELSPAMRRFAEGGQVSASVCEAAQCWLTPGVQSSPTLVAHSLDIVESLLA